ncbi:MAG: amidohydrolase family protein [Deltaproteobacteria bacterium]|nr:amidohydrolase family protein [Deltaproteobacteria bacterium]
MPRQARFGHPSGGVSPHYEVIEKGSITPGKLADLVVLGGNLDELPVEEIKALPVDMTILNGEVVWERMR